MTYGPKNIHWTPERQAHLEEVRRILGTESDSATVARAVELIATRGVPAVDPREIQVRAQAQGLYIVSYGGRAVGRIVNREGRWYLTMPMDKPKDVGEVTEILHNGGELKMVVELAMG